MLRRQDPVGTAVGQDMTRDRDTERGLAALSSVGGAKRLFKLAAVTGQQKLACARSPGSS
jgi:hypothetical protein